MILKGLNSLSEFSVRPVAGVSWYGAVDFTDIDLFIPPAGIKPKGKPDRFVKRINKSNSPLSYKTADEKTRKMVEEMSPVYYIDKNDPPVLHIHGDKDPVLPAKHAMRLKEKANAAKASVEIIMVKEAGHGWFGKKNTTRI